MQVNRKTRNITKHLRHLQPGDEFLLGLQIGEALRAKLVALGFAEPLAAGQSLLPPSRPGPACRRNAEGFDIIHRDQPMETVLRQVEWHWTQFAGRDQTEEVSKVVDVPYKRYPRTRVPPYSTELSLRLRFDGALFVVAGPFRNEDSAVAVATNTANMLREALGAFEVLALDLASWVGAPVKRLNWRLLPLGRNPWASARGTLEAMTERLPAGNRGVVRARLEAVGAHAPDFIAVGLGGFDGYTAFGFESRKLCVLECPHVNNATYVLDLQSWETIAQLSKAEVLDAKAHRARIVHTRGWFDALDDVLGPGRLAA
jgi:hypothetical protein